MNETYYIGEKARNDPDSVRVVEAARECLDEAIKLVKPGALFRNYGNVIEKHAKSKNCSVIKSYCGHGINSLFHCSPNIPHYAKNKAVGEAKPGMCFTIEPMIALGVHRDKTWPDDWTSVTQDGKRTAQFGTFDPSCLSKSKSVLIANRAHSTSYRRWCRDFDSAYFNLSWRPSTNARSGGRRKWGKICKLEAALLIP